MVMITNRAAGPRGFNVGKRESDEGELKKGSSIGRVVLMPGESKDVDLHDADHPAIKGMVESGEIILGDKAPDADKAKPKFNIEGLSADELRAFIKDRTGADPAPGAKKDDLMAQARTLAA